MDEPEVDSWMMANGVFDCVGYRVDKFSPATIRHRRFGRGGEQVLERESKLPSSFCFVQNLTNVTGGSVRRSVNHGEFGLKVVVVMLGAAKMLVESVDNG